LIRIVTDTAGTAYNASAATSVLVGVNSTVASVNTAISAINSGTLAGQVPALGLINALSAAQVAEDAGHTANTAAVNALVTKLAANVTPGTQTDLLAANATYDQKVAAIVADSATFRVTAGTTGATAEPSTAVLTTRAADAATAVTTARAALTATEKAAGATYEAAVVTEAAALAAKPTAAVKAGAISGLQADTTATAGLATFNKAAVVDDPATVGVDETAPAVTMTAELLYANYVAGTAAQRIAIDTAMKDSAYYATFKASAVKDGVYVDAVKASLTAKDVLDTAAGVSTQVVDGVTVSSAGDTVVSSTASNDFLVAATAKAAADATLVKAQAADVDVAAVKAITDANKALSTATVKAGTDIANFNSSNTTVKAVAVTGATTADAAVKESFYFTAKQTGAVDYNIGTTTAANQFGAGDSIVLGSAYTFNSGALTTGNNNALEFFLVKTDVGTQVVVEGSVFGSASVTPNATTGVATAADAVTVINLVGVTADHLSVANGVVSYV